jgi:hypothetical protein
MPQTVVLLLSSMSVLYGQTLALLVLLLAPVERGPQLAGLSAEETEARQNSRILAALMAQLVAEVQVGILAMETLELGVLVGKGGTVATPAALFLERQTAVVWVCSEKGLVVQMAGLALTEERVLVDQVQHTAAAAVLAVLLVVLGAKTEALGGSVSSGPVTLVHFPQLVQGMCNEPLH